MTRFMFLIASSLALSGCFYGLAGIDMSFEGRHKRWVEYAQKSVGKNIFNCIDSSPCYQYRGSNGRFEGDKVLDNGNVEAAYFLSPRKKCRYFYKYDPATGLIVGFRFVESEQYACLVSGA
jgi:hypothetical protein